MGSTFLEADQVKGDPTTECGWHLRQLARWKAVQRESFAHCLFASRLTGEFIYPAAVNTELSSSGFYHGQKTSVLSLDISFVAPLLRVISSQHLCMENQICFGRKDHCAVALAFFQASPLCILTLFLMSPTFFPCLLWLWGLSPHFEYMEYFCCSFGLYLVLYFLQNCPCLWEQWPLICWRIHTSVWILFELGYRYPNI